MRAAAHRVGFFCGLLAVLIGSAGLLPVIFDLPVTVARWLVMHRMAAAAFVLGGLALMALHSARLRMGTSLLVAMVLLAGLNFIALDAGVHLWLSEVFGIVLADDIQMAPMTSALFLASGATMLLCRFRGEDATIPAAIVAVLCVGLLCGLAVRFTVAGDYWPVLASVTPHSGTGHMLLALGSLAGVLARRPALLRERQRLLVVGLVMLLSAMSVIALGVVSWRDYQATVREVEAETSNLARLLEEHAHRRLEPVLLLLRQMAAAPGRDADQRVLGEGARDLPQLWALLGNAGASGSARVVYGALPDADVLFALERFGRRVGDGGGVAVEAVAGGVSPVFVLGLAQPGTQEAVLAVLDARYFQGFYGALRLGDDGVAGLFDADGRPLAVYPQDADVEHMRRQVFETHAGAPAGSFIDRSAQQGPEHFVAFRHSAVLPVSVAASVALTPAIRHFEARLRTTLLLMLAALAALGCGAQLQIAAIRREEEARDALEASRDFADAVLDSMDAHIAILDQDGEIVATNRAWRALREASGCSDADRSQLGRCEVCRNGLSSPGSAEQAAMGIAAVREGRRAAFLLTYPCRFGDDPRWFNLRVTPFAGRAGHVVVSHEDVTELKLAERALAQAKSEAESANRAKTRFLANTSHELRTPLTAVLGLTRLLAHSGLDARQAELVGRVETASNALLAIINDILDLSKIEAGKIELDAHPFELPALLDDVVAIFAGVAGSKSLELSLHADPLLPPVIHGDGMRLQQVLMNLLGNALKFTDHGEVCLEVTRVVASTEQLRVRFAVRDSGIGMSAEQIERLFQPFVQGDSSTTRRFGGTGLGLAISRRLVALMGGELGVSSRPGVGSEFHFELGFSTAEKPETRPVQETVRLDGYRVLVVEDNEVNRQLVAEVLELAGASPLLAADGGEAVRLLADPQVCVDAVLMDVQMPGIDGLEASRMIREMPQRACLPIIAMTANAFGAECAECLAAGMDEHLSKPLDIDRLYAVLHSLIERSLPAASELSG